MDGSGVDGSDVNGSDVNGNGSDVDGSRLPGRQLAAIGAVLRLAAGAGIPVWLRGGWAMDFHLGEITRPHRDVDWYCWHADADRLAALLTGAGWRPDPAMPAATQLDLLRDDVELSFAYLGRDGAGRVVVGAGPWAGTPLPAGLLDAPPGRIGSLTAPIIAPAAQIEFKEMYPVWMPERPRRAKDAADLARLRASLGHPATG
ncbi:nucleotidyltransferase domain-containing protein [Micromonospora sp. PLK6-60]|uniref:nucleotidyltransferase domain-containing protein n=1 Tax=Micromonospora sp. PLK6-60 TaxID=2873383 RepID=UPI0027DF6DE8|nr:aminoglycoside adenylyltransferase [Micromonospora sp. PLK6-60]